MKLTGECGRPPVAIAPDGHMSEKHRGGKTPTSPSGMAAIPEHGGEPISHFDAPAGMFRLSWSPTGKAFQYILTRQGVGNLWEQPVSGGPPRQLTHFKSDQIADFAWSGDGKQVVFARGQRNSNVVLLSNFY